MSINRPKEQTMSNPNADRAAAALDSLDGYDLSLILEAVDAHAKTLREQVSAADARAERNGLRRRTYCDGYVGQHDSTQTKRRTASRLAELSSTIVTAAANRYISEREQAKSESEVTA
jgi:hypothetical protein